MLVCKSCCCWGYFCTKLSNYSCFGALMLLLGLLLQRSIRTIVLVPWRFCWGYFCEEVSEQLFWCLDAFVGVTFAQSCPSFLVSMLHWSIFKDGLYLQSIMLPHELFHCMWKEYKEYFIHALAPGGSNRLVSFWKNFEKHPCNMYAKWCHDCNSTTQKLPTRVPLLW